MFRNILLNFFFSLPFSTRAFWLKRKLLNFLKIKTGTGARITGQLKFFGRGDVIFGDECWLGIGCQFYIPDGISVLIGARCDIGPEVIFQAGTHENGDSNRRAGLGLAHNIEVGPGSWLGVRTTLLPGVILGPGTIVAAGAVVLPGKYPPNVLLAGVPARIIKELGI